jgi:hypothetical protein
MIDLSNPSIKIFQGVVVITCTADSPDPERKMVL